MAFDIFLSLLYLCFEFKNRQRWIWVNSTVSFSSVIKRMQLPERFQSMSILFLKVLNIVISLNGIVTIRSVFVMIMGVFFSSSAKVTVRFWRSWIKLLMNLKVCVKTINPFQINFRKPWKLRLGLSSSPNLFPELWSCNILRKLISGNTDYMALLPMNIGKLLNY